jgi:catechol 2,3-dioxygenase-like lactoylglutathione lyase family enzyme
VLKRLDHLVILVRDLDRAVRDYEGLGFTVTPGGEHADGLTRNALIPFADGSYLELVAFVDPEDPRDNVWGWRAFLPSGGGLIDYCAASDDLEADVRRFEESGLGVEGPTEGGRRLPDGTEIRWRVARIRQKGRLLPFLIEDLTPARRASPADRPPSMRTARPASPVSSSPAPPPGISRPYSGLPPVTEDLTTSADARSSRRGWRNASTPRSRDLSRPGSRLEERASRASWTGDAPRELLFVF